MSSGFIVAVNLFVSPLSIESSPLKDTLSIGTTTFTSFSAFTFPTVAVIFAVPPFFPVIFPVESILTISGFDDSQSTVLLSVVFVGLYVTVNVFSSFFESVSSPFIVILSNGILTV